VKRKEKKYSARSPHHTLPPSHSFPIQLSPLQTTPCPGALVVLVSRRLSAEQTRRDKQTLSRDALDPSRSAVTHLKPPHQHSFLSLPSYLPIIFLIFFLRLRVRTLGLLIPIPITIFGSRFRPRYDVKLPGADPTLRGQQKNYDFVRGMTRNCLGLTRLYGVNGKITTSSEARRETV